MPETIDTLLAIQTVLLSFLFIEGIILIAYHFTKK